MQVRKTVYYDVVIRRKDGKKTHRRQLGLDKREASGWRQQSGDRWDLGSRGFQIPVEASLSTFMFWLRRGRWTNMFPETLGYATSSLAVALARPSPSIEAGTHRRAKDASSEPHWP